MAIVSTIVESTATSIHTSSGSTAITSIYLCNRTGSATTVNVHVVLSGGTAGANNIVYNGLTINGTDTYVIDSEKLLLSNGDSIQALASTNSAIVATVSYTSI